MAYILNKNIIYTQPKNAFRGGLDAVLLAMATPLIDTGDVLDVGCGSGAVGLMYAYLTTDTVRITGIEKSEVFCKYAQNNIQVNSLQHRMQVQHGDISPLIAAAREQYDIVMTNPPYAQHHTGTQSKNPLKHIAHTETTVDICQWLQFCWQSVKTKGRITMIHKTDRLPHILQCLSDKKAGVKILPIITKAGENTSRILIHITKGVNSSFTLKPPLTVYKNGVYTPHAEKILSGTQHIVWE